MSFAAWVYLVCAVVVLLVFICDWLKWRRVKRFVEQSDLQRIYDKHLSPQPFNIPGCTCPDGQLQPLPSPDCKACREFEELARKEWPK